MNVIKIVAGDIEVDVPIPWAVYDEADCMLLKAGFIFKSQKKISEVIEHGVYRDRDALEPVKVVSRTDNEVTGISSPFILVNEYADRLGDILENIEEGERKTRERVIKLAENIMWLCDRDMEAIMAIIHLPASHKKYCLYHAIHVAMLSSVLAMRMNIHDGNRLSMICASLTANIGMRNFQKILQRQSVALTLEQRNSINEHPLISACILRKAGIDDEFWLKIVEQHHEQIDGGGYPRGLKGKEVITEASIISIVDVYTAMMSKRAGRARINVQDALREFFVEKGGAYSEVLSLYLIKELGIYPPGTFVHLANGEIAIVVKRLLGKSNTPIVKSVVGADGSVYSVPLRRDTSVKQFQIMESIFFDRDTPLNYEQIWGYA